jgi:hypothetical protein
VKKITVVLVLSLAVVAGLAIPGASQTPEPNRVNTTCAFYAVYQRRQVDPIVNPGKEKSAHMHDFYGRQDISNYMFARALWPPFRDDPGYSPLPSSCVLYGDWASYWYPTPMFNGVNITSGQLQETWQSPAGSQVASPPFGMLAIVGNSKATSEATQDPHVRWTCGDLNGPGFPSPQDCTGIGTVTAELTFPDCWDGHRQLADTWTHPAGIHPKHFAYSDASGVCPGTHPTRIAQLITRQHFIDPRTGTVMTDPFNADGSLGLSFASGPYYTYHGDFINSWNIGLKTVIVDRCLNHIGASCPV